MSQPNILLIVADDMGYGDFGIFNDQVSCTPHLDALAGESVCLTQHYSASAVCAPARAGLLTGRYPHRTGAIDTLEGRGLDRLHLDEVTLADVLHANGYVTGMVGKWHNGALDPRYHPNARGFHEYVGFRGGWQDYFAWRLDYNGSFQRSDGRYLTEVFTEEALGFITRHQDEPFFLHLAYNAPHVPLQAPEAIAQKYIAQGLGLGVSLIYAMIEVMDAGIGRILESLDEHGLVDNTIVLFTSDNGPALGQWRGLIQNRFNCGFNGSKGNVYEGGIRVPLIIRWPEGLEGGRNYSEMVHFTDWFPTLLAAAGIDVPANLKIDGQNILPVLRDEGGKVPDQRFWQWNRYTPVASCNAAMRDGAWKLLRPVIREAMIVSASDLAMDNGLKYHPEHYDSILVAPEPEREIPAAPAPLLFNIDEDPLEQHDLAQQFPQKVDAMSSALESWFREVENERLRGKHHA